MLMRNLPFLLYEVIPRYKKAHVHIRITAPRETNSSKVWDTSNRAINVIINNLKGILPKSIVVAIPTHAPGSQKAVIISNTKRGCCP